jgi:hypothetical protein
MMPAPHGRSWEHYVIGVLINIAIFVAIGPAIGALVALALIYASAAGTSGMRGAWSGAVTFVLFLPLALVGGYLKGWLAAAATGLVVAMASSWVNSRALYAVAVVAGGVLSLVFLWIEDRTIGESRANVILAFLVGAVAGGVCTRLAKAFRLSTSGASEIADASRVAH